MRTLVFIPAWNEEQNLPAVLDELHVGLPKADVLVIDDGSTDATAAVAAAHGAIVVSFGENRGLRAGIAARSAATPVHRPTATLPLLRSRFLEHSRRSPTRTRS